MIQDIDKTVNLTPDNVLGFLRSTWPTVYCLTDLQEAWMHRNGSCPPSKELNDILFSLRDSGELNYIELNGYMAWIPTGLSKPSFLPYLTPYWEIRNKRMNDD